MKFIPDANPKRVRLAAETAAEEAWMSTLKESAKRIARGAEHFVLKACAEWISANGGAAAVAKKAEAAMPGVASLAAAWGASTNAAPAPQWREGATVAAAKAKDTASRAEKRGGRIDKLAGEVREWAYRLWYDSDYRDGIDGKASSGGLVGLANQLAQVAGIPGPNLHGVPWNRRAEEILGWLDDYML